MKVPKIVVTHIVLCRVVPYSITIARAFHAGKMTRTLLPRTVKSPAPEASMKASPPLQRWAQSTKKRPRMMRAKRTEQQSKRGPSPKLKLGEFRQGGGDFSSFLAGSAAAPLPRRPLRKGTEALRKFVILVSIGTLVILTRHSATASHTTPQATCYMKYPYDSRCSDVLQKPDVRARSPHPLAEGGLELHGGPLLNNTLADSTWQ